MVLAVGAYIMGKNGAYTEAKMLGSMSQMIGIFSAILGLIASIQSAFSRFASEAGKTTAQYTVTEFVVDYAKSIVTSFTDKVTSVFQGFSVDTATSITLKDVAGWISNAQEYIGQYFKFFGDKQNHNTVEDDQPYKEEGVEGWYNIMNVIDERDALTQMDTLVRNNNGGQRTENFMANIS